MVTIKNKKLIITLGTKDPKEQLRSLRTALTCVTATLVESDEFYNNRDLPDSLATLIRLHGELDTVTE